ncbi:MAG: M24B family metallopeptidase, partial [Pseudomonadota bacterium]
SQDPCLLPQACKNSVEITGARNAHIRDGTALVDFLAWLSRVVPAKNITELDASKKLLSYRQLQQYFEEPSFPTISSAGPNGAIIHYCPTPETNRTLQPDELYLVDSGGQYLDGTTDVTRVMAFAAPTDEQRDRFTRVLKGHIALAQARFPQGTTGQQLDILARYWLWQAGLDFEHSTGHGVGSYLSVHEGPQNISKARAGTTHVPLQVGMLLSNEPGYYKSGEYGMRIESIVVVKELENESYEYPILGFETITLAPICRALIEPKLLSTSDINWLNRYHKKVREILMPLVEETARSWLQKETEEIT